MASPTTTVTGSSLSATSINPRMRVVVTRAAGGPEVLELKTKDLPILQADQVLIRVVATCTNKIDLLERKETANLIPGHECSGYIAEVGANVIGWQINEPVCALLRGSGYADYVAVPASFVFRIPRNISVEVASSLPFLACSSFQAISECGELKEGKTLLIHDASRFGEVGLFAMRLAKALYKTKVIVVSGIERVLRRYRECGVDYCLELGVHDILKEVDSLTDKRGVDVVLLYGGYHVEQCQRCLSVGGFMIVVFDVQESRNFKLKYNELVHFSLRIKVCDLRHFVTSWSQEKLSVVVEKVREQVWPLLEDGRLTCGRLRVMPLSKAATAHKRMENRSDEKIILTMEMEKETPPLEKLTSMLTNNFLITNTRAMMDSLLGDQINLTANKRKND